MTPSDLVPLPRKGMSPAHLVSSLWQNRHLAYQLAKRELTGRYRGSWLGLAWSFLNPLLMLAIYTFVFAIVFNARWGSTATEGTERFAIVLFAGLIVYWLFAECVNRAPGLILASPSYVKKVVFPLEILPVSTLGAALFHMLISLVVLFLGMLATGQPLHWTALLFPFVIAPLVIGTLGLMWFLSGLGVYLRDIGQAVALLTTGLMFLSPVFYPISAVPERHRYLLELSPLTQVIEATRAVLVNGQVPDLTIWFVQMIAACVLAWLGFAWFQKARKGFADVV